MGSKKKKSKEIRSERNIKASQQKPTIAGNFAMQSFDAPALMAIKTKINTINKIKLLILKFIIL